MKVLHLLTSRKAKAWCKRNGYDPKKIMVESLRNRVVVLYCERVYEMRVWGITDREFPAFVINPDAVWIYEEENPYTK